MLRCSAVRIAVRTSRARSGAAAFRGYRDARSSNTYPTKNHKTLESVTKPLNFVSPRDGAVPMVSKPDFTKASTGLWQTGRRATPQLLSVDSATLLERLLLSRTTSKPRRVDKAKPRTPRKRRSPDSTHATSKLSAKPPLTRYWGTPYLAENLLVEYETPDVALQALSVLHDHIRTKQWDRLSWLQKDHWQNADEVFGRTSYIAKNWTFYRNQEKKLHEAAYERAHGATKLVASHALRRFTSVLSAEVKTDPLFEQSRRFDWLTRMIRSSPYSRLRALGPQLQVVSEETVLILKNILRIRTIINSPDSYEKRYETAKRQITIACEGLRNASLGLWIVLAGTFNVSQRDKTPGIRAPLHTFNTAQKKFSRQTMDIAQDLAMIGVRRQGSKSLQENIFNALHHHIKLLRSSIHGGVGSIQRSYNDICLNALRQSRRRPRSVPALAHEESFRKSLRALDLNNQYMINIYYNTLLPLWTRHVELMSPSELQSQDRVAQRYWLAQLRFDDTHVLREAELSTLYLPIRRSRNLLAHCPGWSRAPASSASRTWQRKEVKIHEEAIKAIERLEQVLPSHSRNDLQGLRGLLRLDGKSATRSKDLPYRSKPPSTTHGRKAKGETSERRPKNYGPRPLGLLHTGFRQPERHEAGASHNWE